MLHSGILGFCCHITTVTCRGQHPRFYSLSFILLSRVHISVSSLVCTVSAPFSLVYRPQDSGCGPALSARSTPISHIYSMLLIALYERSQLSCKRQLCCIRFMVVVSVGLLFLSQDLAYLFFQTRRGQYGSGLAVVSIREPGGFSIPSYSSPVVNPCSQVCGSSIMLLTSGPGYRPKS